jgi:hypothetical protein
MMVGGWVGVQGSWVLYQTANGIVLNYVYSSEFIFTPLFLHSSARKGIKREEKIKRGTIRK